MQKSCGFWEQRQLKGSRDNEPGERSAAQSSMTGVLRFLLAASASDWARPCGGQSGSQLLSQPELCFWLH